MIKLGYNVLTGTPICTELFYTGHLCCVGGTGSGKSMGVLYFLYNLRKTYKAKLYICDFKKSGDYKGISDYYAEYEDVIQLIEDYYIKFEKTPENNPEIKLLLIDEYAGFIIWLIQRDKKKAEIIKSMISNILMLGRSRHCFIWCIQQRISAALFPSGVGAIDNFQICIGLGRLSVESRKSLFAGEHLENLAFEENYHPSAGQGLILIDGQELQPLQIPYINDKKRLCLLLQKLYSERRVQHKNEEESPVEGGGEAASPHAVGLVLPDREHT